MENFPFRGYCIVVLSPAPIRFRGSWRELYRDQIEPNLPLARDVDKFHDWLLTYCSEPLAVFPVRVVRGMDRRKLYSTKDGTVMAPSDNSPGWAVHALLVARRLSSYSDFKGMMTRMPVHIFETAKLGVPTANSRGWYVAHLYPAKNGNTDFRCWTRTEVERRSFLAFHPCNMFLVPGKRNRRHGEDPDVISFVKEQYAARYGSTWADFRNRVQGVPHCASDREFGDTQIEFDFSLKPTGPSPELSSGSAEFGPSSSSPAAASYSAPRLNFKRDVIEALGLDGQFEIVTPFGIYRFTKREFYAEFPKIVRSMSYRERGSYHGKQLHLKARTFRVGD